MDTQINAFSETEIAVGALTVLISLQNVLPAAARHIPCCAFRRFARHDLGRDDNVVVQKRQHVPVGQKVFGRLLEQNCRRPGTETDMNFGIGQFQFAMRLQKKEGEFIGHIIAALIQTAKNQRVSLFSGVELPLNRTVEIKFAVRLKHIQADQFVGFRFSQAFLLNIPAVKPDKLAVGRPQNGHADAVENTAELMEEPKAFQAFVKCLRRIPRYPACGRPYPFQIFPFLRRFGRGEFLLCGGGKLFGDFPNRQNAAPGGFIEFGLFRFRISGMFLFKTLQYTGQSQFQHVGERETVVIVIIVRPVRQMQTDQIAIAVPPVICGLFRRI